MNAAHPLVRYFLAQARLDGQSDEPMGVATMLSTASKLGPPEHVRTFNRSLQRTCCAERPDGSTIASKVCRARCYAWKISEGREILERAEKNDRIAQRSDFVRLMCGAIRHAGVTWFRINDIGDFASPKEVDAWRQIAATLSDVKFWLYTRAWRDEQLLQAILHLAALPNVDVLFSWDRSMPEPPLCAGIPLAWLADTDADAPPSPVQVVFRATAERSREEDRRRKKNRSGDVSLAVLPHRNLAPLRSIGESPVCPHQTGYPVKPAYRDCVSCRLCMPKARRTMLTAGKQGGGSG